MDESIKEAMIKAYLLRCRLVYKVKYYTWKVSILNHESDIQEVILFIINAYRKMKL